MTCPCTIVTPCKKTCTCARGHMSGGCLRCASYGSAEQRRFQAEALARALDSQPDLLVALRQARQVIEVAMRQDLPGFTYEEQTEIIRSHVDVQCIDAAIAKATGTPAPKGQ